ncbi:MAG TPA: twin-arginine translocation signal domain-containing protein [Pyrinomonadaceae bacterium]|jgi:hypothetical protein
MSISRRQFLRAGAVAMLAAGTPLRSEVLAAAAAGPAGRGGAARGARLRREMFAPHLNSLFTIHPEAGRALRVELTKLEDYVPASPRQRAARTGQECFSLSFRAPAHAPLAQGTYRFQHGALGRFELFITPGRASRDGQTYEAVINHLRA